MPRVPKYALPLVIALTPSVVLAHPGHGGHGFAGGFAHPLSGVDHIAAMLAIGLWAAYLGRRAVWSVPAAFLGAMIGGGALAALRVPLPMAESGILASVLIMGLVLLFALRMPTMAAAALAGAFAVCHGYAHVADMAGAGSLPAYAGGFAISSVFLLGAGVLAGRAIVRMRDTRWLRACGGAVAMLALALALA